MVRSHIYHNINGAIINGSNTPVPISAVSHVSTPALAKVAAPTEALATV